jgi:hypothetical protein
MGLPLYRIHTQSIWIKCGLVELNFKDNDTEFIRKPNPFYYLYSSQEMYINCRSHTYPNINQCIKNKIGYNIKQQLINIMVLCHKFDAKFKCRSIRYQYSKYSDIFHYHNIIGDEEIIYTFILLELDRGQSINDILNTLLNTQYELASDELASDDNHKHMLLEYNNVLLNNKIIKSNINGELTEFGNLIRAYYKNVKYGEYNNVLLNNKIIKSNISNLITHNSNINGELTEFGNLIRTHYKNVKNVKYGEYISLLI